ncbi:cyclin-dependent kinase inhibitor 7 [Lactuca sativa]|uniref:Cyclin-dependent kinase inhibitor n=1 Tax=Lactuca sativa TaxID=4236 RepID=A0A9R1V0S3_LACSA|nr:cyclin-dependent kinase inhibitor 7 [Lactuca sativa]KAJ0196263.1 hypothetical protein LSAT_V11C700376630 [Lactuca sativa]
MIEETCTSGCESTEEVSTMEVPNSHGDVRRSRDTDVSSSGTGKRRRLDSQAQENVFQLQFQSRSEIGFNFHENVVLTAESGVSDHVSSFICSINDDSRPDLKAECLSETEIFMSSNDGFSRETSASSVVSLESEEMESLSTSTPKNKKKTAAANEATSGRKPPPEKSPSPAELEEFFSEAEKYEQKRFTEKYNYDIVKDVPMEGRYQWVRLKP